MQCNKLVKKFLKIKKHVFSEVYIITYNYIFKYPAVGVFTLMIERNATLKYEIQL